MSDIAIDPRRLSPQERLDLIERLWDSLDDVDVPITQSQREELARRLEDFDRGRESAVPWEVLKDQLRRR